ncbi:MULTISPECIES: MarC family protein [unclassified Thioalkalivibrio]|uniref:MarC family protein n=1 Tax=unclassified Thioalkalivibrio TaxID=2621013 RepID=UPI00037D49E4|nr:MULTISPECIES: MarC family protein [unclassified Thioalkalivibrio]
MLELGVVALATFFVTVGPVDVAVVFAVLSQGMTRAQRRRMAWRAALLATGILMLFALFGEAVLSVLGITMPALYTAGGILLLLIGIDMVFARSSGGVSATPAETSEARSRGDISVFPLATPMLAGPGAMGAAILLMSRAGDDWMAQAVVLGALAAIMVLALICLLVASRLQHLLGVTGAHVLTRILGVLLCALAMQFIFDGLEQSGLLG